MVGWSDMLDTEGNELPFSDAYVNKFLDVAGVAAYIADAFSEAYTGGLKRKNY